MLLFRYLAVLAIIFVSAGDAALAQTSDRSIGPLTVVQPWSRATAPSQKAGGVFLRIENAGDQPDRLIAAESGLADVTSLHTMIREGDVMKMRPIEGGIEVPANGHAELAPGGKHVMLIGLRQQLVKDTTIPLTLIFERAGRLQIEAVVEAAGSRGPAPTPAGGADHGKHR